jgi:hypothetical protein
LRAKAGAFLNSLKNNHFFSILLNNDDFFWSFVEARTYALLRHKVVVTHGTPNRCLGGRRMNRDIHPGFDFHRFILPDERALDKVISLPVGIKPFLRRVSLFLEEIVVGLNNVSRICPGL